MENIYPPDGATIAEQDAWASEQGIEVTRSRHIGYIKAVLTRGEASGEGKAPTSRDAFLEALDALYIAEGTIGGEPDAIEDMIAGVGAGVDAGVDVAQ